MSEESKSRADREGIHIEREVADSVAIEEELDANVVGPFKFPGPGRRRIAGWVFLAAGLVATVTIDGGWLVGVGFGMLAIWQFVSAAAVDFTIGHASAAVRFHGWRSRPRWSVVLYSASEPPDQRALVVVDAVSGDVVEQPYVEDIEAV